MNAPRFLLLLVAAVAVVATVEGCGGTPAATVTATPTATVTVTATPTATVAATPTATFSSTPSPTSTARPVSLTAKQKHEYKLIVAFFAAGKKIEKTAMSAISATANGDYLKSQTLIKKASNMYYDALAAADKNGFLSAGIMVGGPLKTLEKRFVKFADALTLMLQSPSATGFADYMAKLDRSKAPLQAELNRIAGR